MGLQVTSLTLDNGITLSNTYVKMNNINGGKDQLTYNMNYYVSREDKIAGRVPVKQSELYTFTPSPEADSVRWDKQAYEDAKTREEFTGAIDVIE